MVVVKRKLSRSKGLPVEPAIVGISNNSGAENRVGFVTDAMRDYMRCRSLKGWLGSKHYEKKD